MQADRSGTLSGILGWKSCVERSCWEQLVSHHFSNALPILIPFQHLGDATALSKVMPSSFVNERLAEGLLSTTSHNDKDKQDTFV